MAEILLLEETSFGSISNPPYGFSRIISPSPFALEIGAKYRVVFDGTEYSCIGVDASPLGTGAVGIGNGAAFGLAGSGEPFCVGTFSGAMIVLCLLDTEPTQHSIAIYKKEEAASGLVTENYDGTQNVFYGVETVSLENTDGEIETFVHESLVAEPVEATVDVDWSGGDMVVTPDEGKVFSSVNIPAPENLIPQNIAEGVNIAGIIGALTAGGGLSECNCLVKTVDMSAVGSGLVTIIPGEELKTAGFTLYSATEPTANHLWTIIMLISTEHTAGATKKIFFAFRQNAVLGTYSGSARTNGVCIYSNGTGAMKSSNSSAPTNCDYSIGGKISMQPMLTEEGMSVSLDVNKSAFPQGKCMAIVIQHKTKTASQLINGE